MFVQCEEVFSCQSDLKNHLRLGDHKWGSIVATPHGKLEGKLCPDCGKQFPNKCTIQDHQTKHSDEKNFVCMERGKCSKRRKKFAFPHEEACWNRGLYCDECHAKYVSTSALVGHKQAKHTDLPSNDNYLCNYFVDKVPEKRILGKACYQTHRRETLYMQ